LRAFVGIELKTSNPSSIRCRSYQHKRQLCIASTSSFDQPSRRFASASALRRTERPDDLYIPFEESLLGHESNPLEARALAATNSTLPWTVASVPQRSTRPRDPTCHGSVTTMAVYRNSFEPDIHLRDGFYSGDGDRPTFSQFLSPRNDIFPGSLGTRIHTAGPSIDLGNPADSVMVVEPKRADAAVDVLVRLPPMDAAVSSVRVPPSQENKTPNANVSLSTNDPNNKPPPSNQPWRSKTAEARNGASRKAEPWQAQKRALQQKFGEQGWSPRKRLSPDALEGIRALHAQYPEKFTTPVLADQFKVSPEAIRRILRSKWRPDEAEESSRRQRWDKRGETIWRQMVELGVKPPKRWREMGVIKTNAVQDFDLSTTGHHRRRAGRWKSTERRGDYDAEQNPKSGTVFPLEPEELLEERIL
jgi:hypothetical protein